MANASFTTPRVLDGAEVQAIGTTIRVEPCEDLIEPTAQSLSRDCYLDANWKPAFGVANGLLWGSHEAGRLYLKGCGDPD